MKTHTEPKPRCTCSDDVFDISPHCKVHAQPKTAAAAPEAPQHSPLPWQALDGMILCDKVNKYGNFYVAEVSAQFRDIANAEALSEASANLAFIVEACNNYKRIKAERDELLAACKVARAAFTHSHDGVIRFSDSERTQIKTAIANAEPSPQGYTPISNDPYKYDPILDSRARNHQCRETHN